MKVTIKQFDVAMEIKNRGVELEVRTPDGSTHKGDLLITKTKLVWCPGRTAPENGHKVSWTDFIEDATMLPTD